MLLTTLKIFHHGNFSESIPYHKTTSSVLRILITKKTSSDDAAQNLIVRLGLIATRVNGITLGYNFASSCLCSLGVRLFYCQNERVANFLFYS